MDASSRPTKVLVVDDEAPIRTALARFFERRGFDVQSAGSGDEALERLKGQRFDLVLLDVRMPGRSGLDIVPDALDLDPDLAILMLSAIADATSASSAMQRGAMDYLTKPIEMHDLAAAVERALRKRDTIHQSRQLTSWLKDEVDARTQEVQRERLKLEQVTIATLEALINVLEAKTEWLTGHSQRVAAIAAGIASELGLGDDDIERVRLAARLHDLGKIGIREAVLEKDGPLTEDERQYVESHAQIGARILAPLTHLGPVADYVGSHHEHFDGSGYPAGLAGETIPIGARIIRAAEMFDALTSARPYQDAMDADAAMARMRELEGTVLDPAVMDAFAASMSRRRSLIFLADDLADDPA